MRQELFGTHYLEKKLSKIERSTASSFQFRTIYFLKTVE